MSYVPHTPAEEQAMLATLGFQGTEELFADVPASALLGRPLALPGGLPELEVRAAMESMAARNRVFPTCFRGAGAYRHHIPAAVGRIVGRSEFVTAYTPYQAEMSQGVLQAIFEYQTMICELTGMDASNASVYDGATAASEAIAMCVDAKRRRAVMSGAFHPHTIAVAATWCRTAGVELVIVPARGGVTDPEALAGAIDASTACVLVQQPNFFGQLEDVAAIEPLAHGQGAKLVLSCNPISLGALKSPGEWGADIAIGEGQPLGTPIGYGGPYLGFMACREALQRKLPGRIVGQTTDGEGNRGFVLTLQAREQHIRREKASSNICSNQALNALAAAVYLAAMGPRGLGDAAMLCTQRAHEAAERIAVLPGMRLRFTGPFFHEFVIDSDIAPECIEQALADQGILSGLPLGFLGQEYAHSTLYCCTERNTTADLDRLVEALKEVR